jgi:hypothetical protein
MSQNAHRHNRKANRDRPDWTRTAAPKPDRPGDRKTRNRNRRARQKAAGSYRGGLV